MIREIRKYFIWLAVLFLPLVSWGHVPWYKLVFLWCVSGAALALFADAVTTGRLLIPRSRLWQPFFAVLLICLVHVSLLKVPGVSLPNLLLFIACALLLFFLLTMESLKADWFILVWMFGETVLAAAQLLSYGGPLTGTFLNPNYLSTFYLSATAYFMGCIISGRIGKGVNWKRVYLCMAIVGTVMLSIIGSRSAAIALVMLWAGMFLFTRDWRRWFALAILAAMILLPTAVKYRVAVQAATDPFAYSRIEIWRSALLMGAGNPVIGVGPGLYAEHAPRYAFPARGMPVKFGRIALKPHNEYLMVWAETGIAGLLMLGLFIYILMHQLRRSWGSERAGPALAILAILFQAVFHDITATFALSLLSVWWLAILFSKPSAINEKKQHPVFFAGLILLAALLTAVFSSVDLMARQAWRQGMDLVDSDLTSAVVLLERSVKLNPLHAGMNRDMGNIYRLMFARTGRMYDFDNASGYLDRAKILNPYDPITLRVTAELYEELAIRHPELGNRPLDVALNMLNEASRLAPTNPIPLFKASDIAVRKGRLGEALNYLDRAIGIEPNYLDAQRRRIKVMTALKNPGLDDAVRELNISLEMTRDYRPVDSYEEVILR